MRTSARRSLFLLWLLSALGSVGPVLGCSVCLLPGGGLGVMHPMSIDVAVATASAREAGLLTTAPVSSNIKNQVDRWERIDQFATRCAIASQGKQTARLKMLCVDTGVEAHFRMTGDRAIEIRSVQEKKSMPTDVTVVTSEAAICAMLNGTISPTDAVANGLVHVECASPGGVVVKFQQPVSKVGRVGKPTGVSQLPMAVFILGLALAPALVFLTRRSRNRSS
jgi:hypothetical protein